MVDQLKEIALRVRNKNCAMTTQIVKLQKEERCFGKTIGRNRKSIAKLNTETRIGTTSKAYGKEGTRVHNS